MFGIFKNNTKKTPAAETTLSFDGLNPLLAKQLSELETQIGQLAQVQFELGQERQRMRTEMEALKRAVERPENAPAVTQITGVASDNESLQ